MITTDITTEEKCRIIAPYVGVAKIELDESIKPMNLTYSVVSCIMYNKYPDFHVLVKSLSKITDDEAIHVAILSGIMMARIAGVTNSYKIK